MARIRTTSVDPAAFLAVQRLGGPVQAARILNMGTYVAVQEWVRKGVPARHVRRVEALTGVSRKLLRPKDWADYWPEEAEPAKEPA